MRVKRRIPFREGRGGSPAWSWMVLVAAGILFGGWLIINLPRFAADPDALVRFVLGIVLATLLMVRPKPVSPAAPAAPLALRPGAAAALAATGAVLHVAGMIMRVHQAEWLGLLMVLFACLQWALPARYARDTALAFLLLYWVHPLPGQVFGALQLVMQKLSVKGAEWLLQVGNVRVWADGLVLRTGLDRFEVPAACSGMRTAVTVFILTLGLALLRRFGRIETAVLVLLAMVQALILNVLRISLLVAIIPTGGGDANAQMLHDTTGILILMASLLMAVEVTVWDHLRTRRRERAGEADLEERIRLSHFPPWRTFVIRHQYRLLLAVVLILLGAGLAYRSRPRHRAEMIAAVVESLRNSGRAEEALRALKARESLVPLGPEGDMEHARLLLLKGDYEGALRRIRHVPAETEVARVEREILRAFAFMGLRQLDEADRVVSGLPDNARRDPRVAVILAELAIATDATGDVVNNVLIAAQRYANRERIRAMFPYLERRRQWDVILKADGRAPYTHLESALAAAAAHMNLNNAPAVADIMRQVQSRWPADRRMLIPLYFLARKLPGSDWEETFSRVFLTVIEKEPDAEALYDWFEFTFAMPRPDLAWRLFRRIEHLDPGYPGLMMAAARFGDVWFTFRRQALNMPYVGATQTVDLKSSCLLVRGLPAWRVLDEHIPLLSALAVPDRTAQRKRALADALKGFESRWQNQTLSDAMAFEYALALEMDGRPQQAGDRLRELASRKPALAAETRLAMSEIDERQADWPNVYEILRDYPESPSPQVTPLLRLTESQINLALGLCAMETARVAREQFPQSSRTIENLARVWEQFDDPEEALFLLSRPSLLRGRDTLERTARLLYKTGRYRAATAFGNANQLEVPPPPADARPDLAPVPAERALDWLTYASPTEADYAQAAARLRRNRAMTASPFLNDYMDLWLACYDSHGGAGTTDRSRWMAIGRDYREKATALNQLCLLLCRENRLSEARQAAAAAVEWMPASGLLWRMLISLSGQNEAVIAQARRLCPDDAEVWLAALVAKIDGPPGPRAPVPTGTREELAREVLDEMRTAVEAPRFSTAAMTRAGDFLLRRGFVEAAALAAGEAFRRADGYLPASVLEARCAIALRDRDRLMRATIAILNTTDQAPAMAYRTLVRLKAEDRQTDADMVNALKHLRLIEPEQAQWAEMLGKVRFSRGGMDLLDAMFQSESAIALGSTNIAPFHVSAEVARLIGRPDRAVAMLQQAMERDPGNPVTLNNLVYTLASEPATLTNALALLPDLQRVAADTPARPELLETLCFVLLQAGRLDEARRVLGRLEPAIGTNSPVWFQCQTHRADLLLRDGNPEAAIQILRPLLRNARGAGEDGIGRANRLLFQAREAAFSGSNGIPRPVRREPGA